MKIESINNPKVKYWTKLQEKKYRDQENVFLIEDDHLLKEALKQNLVIEIMAIDKKYEVKGTSFYEINLNIMKKIASQVNGTKVMAVVKKPSNSLIEGNVCLLDNIQDPGNLGTIIRSALAFNIKTIILSLDTVDLYNAKTIRATEGMLFNLNIIREDLTKVILKLKEDGYKIYGTKVKEGTNLKNISFYQKNGIIIGNEGNGMHKSLEDYCDDFINIKINKDCESLNASIAASIIFYELNR